MRKLLIFPGYFLPHVGGLETHVDEFSKYLSLGDYSITIFAPKIPNSGEDEWIHNNRVHVIRYPAFELIPNFPVPKFWSFRFWKLFFSLNKILKSSHDTFNTQFLVMTRTRFFTNSFLGLLFAKFRFKKYTLMHVEHGSDFVRLHSRFKSACAYLYDKSFGKLVIRCADSVVAISESSYDFVRKHFLTSTSVYIPIIKRGVDFEYYRDIEPKDLGYESLVMMSLGRMYKWKGVENAIKAYKQLPGEIKDRCVYLIVGYGEDLDRLKKLASDEKGIVFIGEVGFREAVSYLKRADIFIHSSYPGGALSNSLLQAMECECGIVASPNEGGSEVIRDGENGILLSDNSSKRLRLGMKELIESEEMRTRYSKKAQKDVRREFDWRKVVEQYEREFDKLLK